MLRLVLWPVLALFGRFVSRLLEPLLFIVLAFALGGFLLSIHGPTAVTGGLWLVGLAVMSLVFDMLSGRR